jgi:hypothetical protein
MVTQCRIAMWRPHGRHGNLNFYTSALGFSSQFRCFYALLCASCGSHTWQSSEDSEDRWVSPGLKRNHKNLKQFVHPPTGRPPPSPSSSQNFPQSPDRPCLPFRSRQGPPVACHGHHCLSFAQVIQVCGHSFHEGMLRRDFASQSLFTKLHYLYRRLCFAKTELHYLHGDFASQSLFTELHYLHGRLCFLCEKCEMSSV